MMKPNSPDLVCPKCGDSFGYYICQKVSGYAVTNYNWDGSLGDSTNMHDGVNYHPQKTKRCVQCHAIIRKRKSK